MGLQLPTLRRCLGRVSIKEKLKVCNCWGWVVEDGTNCDSVKIGMTRYPVHFVRLESFERDTVGSSVEAKHQQQMKQPRVVKKPQLIVGLCMVL